MQGDIIRGDVLQIIPGGGWKAVYGFESGGKLHIFRSPLVCFALGKFTDEHFMAPGEDGQLIEGYTGGEAITPAEAAPNLLGYEGPEEENDEDWDQLLKSWWEGEQKIKRGERPVKV